MVANQEITDQGRMTSTKSKKPMWIPPLSSINKSETHISDALIEESEISVSVVSYKEDWGSEALITKGVEQKTHQIAASCTCTGFPKNQDAYISELTGILHVVSIV